MSFSLLLFPMCSCWKILITVFDVIFVLKIFCFRFLHSLWLVLTATKLRPLKLMFRYFLFQVMSNFRHFVRCRRLGNLADLVAEHGVEVLQKLKVHHFLCFCWSCDRSNELQWFLVNKFKHLGQLKIQGKSSLHFL